MTRVALYALNGSPKHAARQVAANVWTSKIGQNIDIEHNLRGLEGPTYGQVVGPEARRLTATPEQQEIEESPANCGVFLTHEAF